MLFKNTSGHTVSLPALGIPTTPPGECVEIDDALCKPGRADNGSRRKSPIEMYAPQLEPADEAASVEWRKTPEPNPVTSRMVTSRGSVVVAQNMPPGVQAAMLAKAAAEAAPPAPVAPAAAGATPAPSAPVAPAKAKAK